MRLLDRGARPAAEETTRPLSRAETAGGPLLLLAALTAFILTNSQIGAGYDRLWHTQVVLGGGSLEVGGELRHWVNEALMTVFFFVVGLEIKRELVGGELRSLRVAAVPVLAATGGVVVPIAIFLLVVGPGAARAGWGIPMATDIAFAVAIIAALGRRVPPGARLLLVSLAVVDDVIAILVIGLFYASSLEAAWLVAAAVGLLAVALMRRRLSPIWPYAVVGFVVWYAVYRSGLHPTIAGVALALLTPRRSHGREVLELLQRRLLPVSAFVVVPVFGLANAGVAIDGDMLAAAVESRVTWGVAAGLLFGKMIGITAATLIALRLRVGDLPAGVTMRHVWGLSALAGIGFTVSLFLAELAYTEPMLVDQAKLGVFAASVTGGGLGAALLLRAGRGGERSAEHGKRGFTRR